MVGFLYLVGMFIAFIALAYFDVKGSNFFGLKPRSESYDTFGRGLFGGMAVLMWPITLALLAVSMLYYALLYIFSRQPKKPRIWTCPRIKPATSYRDPIEYCKSKTKSITRPKCGRHHCEMVEEA